MSIPCEPFGNTRRYAPPVHRRALATTIVMAEVVLDQLSKGWAQRRLDGGRVIELIPTLELDLTYNSGFSFGTGAGAGRFIGVLVLALVCWLVFMTWRETTRRRSALFRGDPRRRPRELGRPHLPR